MIETPPALAATAGGSLLVLAILAPAAGILLSFALGGRCAERIALGLTPIGLAIARRHRRAGLALRARRSSTTSPDFRPRSASR